MIGASCMRVSAKAFLYRTASKSVASGRTRPVGAIHVSIYRSIYLYSFYIYIYMYRERDLSIYDINEGNAAQRQAGREESSAR